MAKGKSTWKYNKLLTARRNYFNIGGDIKNALSTVGTDIKGAFSNPMQLMGGPTSLLGSAANVVGKTANKLLSNGMSSTAGNIIGGIGDAASSIPVIGGFVGGAANLVAGGVNALFGSSINEANVEASKADIARINNVTSSAGSLDEVANQMAATAGRVQHDKSFYGKEGLFSNAVTDIAKNLEAQAALAERRQSLGFTNNIENLQSDTLSGLAGNYAALGGPLFSHGGSIHIKPENRGKFTETKRRTGKTTEELTHSSNPLTRKRAIFAQNAKKWHHAFGGELNTNGADFTNGMIVIGNGGSHESNPFEGVPMGMDQEGTPNLVEEGETIFNDYVFSRRLNVPKAVRNKYKLRGTKNITFAEASKQLAKESEERPNDPISTRGLQALMAGLANEQEAVRAKANGNKFAHGGDMGRKYEGTGELPNQLLLDRQFDPNDFSWMKELNEINESKAASTNNGLAPTWMRYVPAYASGIFSLTDAMGLTNKPDYTEAGMVVDAARNAGTYNPVSFNPVGNYLRYTPFDREFYINQMNAQSGATRRAVMQNAGLNRGAGMAALLASDYNAQGQLGQLARQAEEYNLAQRQKVEELNRATNMFNSEGMFKADAANQEALMKTGDSLLKGTMAAAEIRQRERQQSSAARSANLSNFINSIGDIGRENYARNMILTDPSKYYYIGKDGEVIYKDGFDKLSDTEKRLVRGHAAENRAKTFAARGGFLTIKRGRNGRL